MRTGMMGNRNGERNRRRRLIRQGLIDWEGKFMETRTEHFSCNVKLAGYLPLFLVLKSRSHNFDPMDKRAAGCSIKNSEL